MKVKKYTFFNIAIGIIIASSIVSLSHLNIFQRFKLLGYDFFFRIRPQLSYSPHIIVIEITDEDIASVGRWPWRRRWHAAMTRALKDLGAKYIYFDMIFSEPSTSDDDYLFAEAIKEAACVYLPFAFFQGTTRQKNILLPIPEFSSYLRGTGSINISPDIDGVLRRLPLFFSYKGKIKFHIALQLAMDYLGMHIKGVSDKYLTLGRASRYIVKIPLVDGNKMLINWIGRWENTFKHYSFLDVLEAYRRYLAHEDPSIDLASFKNSICIVAVTALGLYDIKPVPLEAEYPGVGATVTAINNIIQRQFLYTLPVWVDWLLIYIMALLPPFLISEERPLREILSAVSVVVVLVVGYLLFVQGVMVDIALPFLSLVGSYISVGTYNFARISMERRNFFRLAVTDELTGLYNIRYFRMLIRTEALIAKADPLHTFCVLMLDVDHFKHFNDIYGHQVGDLVLSQIAKVVKISVRASDVAARYGGEEFIVLLRSTMLEDGMRVAEKIRHNVESHIIRDKDNTYKVTVSIGVAYFNPDVDDEETVIKRADEGLYKAKTTGRNRVETKEESYV